MSGSSLKIIVQPAALEDIHQQVAYFRRESSEELARRFFEAARDSIDDLTLFPGMGTLVPHRVVPDLRRWRVRDFEKILIFYRFTEASIYVIRILHGATDLDAILADEWKTRE